MTPKGVYKSCAALVLFLNDDMTSGELSFPILDEPSEPLVIAPERGPAVLFYSMLLQMEILIFVLGKIYPF